MITLAQPQPPAYNGNGLVWVLEPVYDEVRYWAGGFYTGGFNYDNLILRTENFVDVFGGVGFHEWLYDKEKELYGYYGIDYEGMYEMFALDKFIEEFTFTGEYGWSIDTKLNAFRKIDSEKVKIETDESGWITFNLDDAYIGKYALAYGTKFITDFIYDYSPYWYEKNDRKNAISVQYNNKWGIIDKNGNALTPFIFDELVFIDDDTAFAKYENKYGILDVTRTAMSMENQIISPKTGVQNLIPFWVIICFFIIKLLTANKYYLRLKVSPK